MNELKLMLLLLRAPRLSWAAVFTFVANANMWFLVLHFLSPGFENNHGLPVMLCACGALSINWGLLVYVLLLRFQTLSNNRYKGNPIDFWPVSERDVAVLLPAYSVVVLSVAFGGTFFRSSSLSEFILTCFSVVVVITVLLNVLDLILCREDDLTKTETNQSSKTHNGPHSTTHK